MLKLNCKTSNNKLLRSQILKVSESAFIICTVRFIETDLNEIIR